LFFLYSKKVDDEPEEDADDAADGAEPAPT